MTRIDYRTTGTCSSAITIELEDDVIVGVEFSGGCRGNVAGLSALVKGRKASEVIEVLRGIQCRNGTSCPDQLSKALAQGIVKKS